MRYSALLLLRDRVDDVDAQPVEADAYRRAGWVHAQFPQDVEALVRSRPSIAGRVLEPGDLVYIWGNFFVLTANGWEAVEAGRLTRTLSRRFVSSREQDLANPSPRSPGTRGIRAQRSRPPAELPASVSEFEVV
ncbi:MAG: hypothetical protein WAT58_03995 [Candidatus Dormiibacterota bacterium]